MFPRRSRFADVVDMETEAMHCSVKFASPAVVLCEFAAAFPSIAQAHLVTVLRFLGIPTGAIRLVQSLCYEHFCTPTLEGQRGSPLKLTAGLRQGYHFSPVLFVVAVDSLLSRSERCSPTTLVRMQAADTARVLRTFAKIFQFC